MSEPGNAPERDVLLATKLHVPTRRRVSCPGPG